MEFLLAGLLTLMCGICRTVRRLSSGWGIVTGSQPCPVPVRNGNPLDPHTAVAWGLRLTADRCCGGIDPPPDPGGRCPFVNYR